MIDFNIDFFDFHFEVSENEYKKPELVGCKDIIANKQKTKQQQRKSVTMTATIF